MENHLVEVIVGILFFGLSLIVAILGWVFKDILNELRKKYNMLEAQFREFENEKYTKILEALGEIREDIASIKTEIKNIKGKG